MTVLPFNSKGVESARWVLMEITEVKPKVTNNKESMIYYEMCDPVTGEKTAGAITTPIKPSIAKKCQSFKPSSFQP